MPPAASALRVGSLFADRYQIEALLGAGGMGAVYGVHDMALGEPVALKLLGFGSDPSPASVLRFRQEVRLARRVTHKNVARVFDVGEDAGVFFLTMELIAGATLQDALKVNGAFPPEAAARIGVELCGGLAAAHAAGIVHRDLKPANVMIETAGRVVIMDFGIARSLLEDSELTHGMIGTPRYMAPEQAAAGAVDARTDLFALGLLLAELVTGSRRGSDEWAAALARAPRELSSIVARCLEPNAAERPRSADEVADALRAVASDELPTALANTVAPTAARAETAREPAKTAPPKPKVRSLVVLPFRYRGPAGGEDLGEGIADALVDVLASTRGLRVLGRSAVARQATERGAQSLGGELGADAVIEGSVQVSGARRRVTIRLIDVATDVQMWSGHFDAEGGDSFDLEERIAGRIAERIRHETTVIVHRGSAPDEAVQMFLEAQRKMRDFELPLAEGAIERLERCIELAPDFAPAFGAHAAACVRSWLLPGDPTPPDWESTCRASVARALDRSGDLSESHLAAGLFHAHVGDPGAALRAISTAVHLAPTSAGALEALGMLECEGGRPEVGVPRLRRALDYDPALVNALVLIARAHAFARRMDDYEAVVREIQASGFGTKIPVMQLRIRVAAWQERPEALRALIGEIDQAPGASHQVLGVFARAFLGEVAARELDQRLAEIAPRKSPRSHAALTQGFAEVMAARGDVAEALRYIAEAADGALIDIAWLDGCPTFDRLRAEPAFVAARKQTLNRVHAMWMA